MYYNKSVKKMLKFLIEAEEVPVDKNQPVDPKAPPVDPNAQTAVAAPMPISGGIPGAPPTPAVSSRVTKIQINPDPSKEDGGVLAKFKSNKSSTIPTKSATAPVVPNEEEEEEETPNNKPKEVAPKEAAPKEEEGVDEKTQFSKRVEKHIKDISGKNNDSSVNKHERKNKQDKRFKEFTGEVERSHKKALGKSVNKDYYKKLDKKLGY